MTNNVLRENISNIASTMIILIFGILGFMIAGWIGLEIIAPALISAFTKLNILKPGGLTFLIGITITLITALAGFYFGGISGEWISSKIW